MNRFRWPDAPESVLHASSPGHSEVGPRPCSARPFSASQQVSSWTFWKTDDDKRPQDVWTDRAIEKKNETPSYTAVRIRGFDRKIATYS